MEFGFMMFIMSGGAQERLELETPRLADNSVMP